MVTGHSDICGIPLVKVLHCCHQCFFGPTMGTDVRYNLCTGHFTYFGPPRSKNALKKGNKFKFSGLRPYVNTFLMEQCWKDLGTTLRKSRLTSLARPRMSQIWLKGGQKVAKIGWKLPFGHTNHSVRIQKRDRHRRSSKIILLLSNVGCLWRLYLCEVGCRR